MSHSSDRINTLAAATKAEKYLEIGVDKGKTFFDVDMPVKVAVDPSFKFSVIDSLKEGSFFYPVPSDDFFDRLPSFPELSLLKDGQGKLSFDIIFLDGLHTYEQTLRDFENSLLYSHADTIWIIDDTVPNDPYSSLPDQATAMKYRRAAGGKGQAWHGDVFKLVITLHDEFRQFSYCTVMDRGNPQTVAWKTESPRSDAASGLDRKDIRHLNYFGMLDHSHLFLPASEESLLGLLGKTLNPSAFIWGEQWQRLMYSPLVTQKEQQLSEEVEKLKKKNASLTAELDKLRKK